MKKKTFALYLIAALLGLLSSCQQGGFIVLLTPTLENSSPACEWPCTEDDKKTAQAMYPTLTGTTTPIPASETPIPPPPGKPSNTPFAGFSYTPVTGDLGTGSVYGTVTDATSGIPIAEAAVTCEHSSYTSPVRCEGITWTNSSGIFAFVPVFFHDTDRIIIRVEATGYQPGVFEQNFFTFAELKAEIKLQPLPTPDPNASPTFSPVCTAPVCSAEKGRLTCGLPGGCPGGCGTICATLTPTP